VRRDRPAACIIRVPCGRVFAEDACTRSITVPAPSLPFAELRRGADKSLAFFIFLFAAEPKEFFLNGLKKLEQRSHKCVELRGNM
jgi:hypothetical protein